MVSTHALTMFAATPERTALTLWTDPTPAMAPVMTCVVETPAPAAVARRIEVAPAVSAQNPPLGFNFVIREPTGMHNAPTAEQCSERDCRVGGEDDPKRDGEALQITGGDQHARYDSHCLLRIIRSMRVAEMPPPTGAAVA
jgi:hypothetical protein